MERIHAIKVAYITDKIHLTSAQAERFWPVYNQYEDEKFALRKKYFANHSRPAQNMDEDDSRKSIDDDIEMQEKMLEIRKRYKDQFLNVISAQQLASLYDAEREFKRMLIQQLKERHANRPQQELR
ncbi:MAG: hypothetical protein BGO70_11085 [Bacteroidetes bacterium 43-93]|jgi:hypothetical protein|nr:MAG: hypothetical protein BGO70_11085 [Bacteroidetes bacterium 43-93]